MFPCVSGIMLSQRTLPAYHALDVSGSRCHLGSLPAASPGPVTSSAVCPQTLPVSSSSSSSSSSNNARGLAGQTEASIASQPGRGADLLCSATCSSCNRLVPVTTGTPAPQCTTACSNTQPDSHTPPGRLLCGTACRNCPYCTKNVCTEFLASSACYVGGIIPRCTHLRLVSAMHATSDVCTAYV
jgi:hypothetical protein